MKTIYKIFLYLILTLSFSANLLAAYKPTQTEESVVRIVASSGGHGTGFFINKDGYIVTNAHVLANGESFDDSFVVVQNYKKKTYMYKAKLVGTPSIEKDFAILKVNANTALPLYMARFEPEKNSTVFAIGFSGYNDDPSEMSKFIFKALKISLSSENKVLLDSLETKKEEIKKILNALIDEVEQLKLAENSRENEEKIREKTEAFNNKFKEYKSIESEIEEIYLVEIKRRIESMEDLTILSPEFYSFAEPSIQEGHIEKITNSTVWGLNRNAKVKIIQHNAPIRGGNSGGPLLNAKGEFIGVNTIAQTSDGEGRNFSQLASSSHYDELVAYLGQNGLSIASASLISTMDILYIVLLVLVVCLVAVLLKKKPKNTSKRKKAIYSSSGLKSSYEQAESSVALIKLEFVDENSKTHKFSIDEKYLRESNNYIILGRSKDFCDVYIDNASLSKQHLGLRYTSGKIYITDRNSLNAVFVDGQKIPPFRSLKINNQSNIKIGKLNGKILCI
ncbi:MAG: trypsin-like peptidase domain-containing protein [Opitutales bacterium]